MHSRVTLLAVTLCIGAPLSAQVPQGVARDRAEYAEWLRTAPTSPFAAIALQRIGPGLTLGPPGSDIVLERMPQVRVSEAGGRVSLDSAGTLRVIPRDRVAALGTWRMIATGTGSRITLTVFGPPHDARMPAYFPWRAAAVDTVELVAPTERRSVLLLSAHGTDVEAMEAGTVTVTRFGTPVTLRVRRFPGATEDESDLEINFRDGTSGQGSYPAGRFVALEPLGNGKYLLDFNRARNPFCAYNTVFPCPAPWPGNAITARVEAGETYEAAKGK